MGKRSWRKCGTSKITKLVLFLALYLPTAYSQNNQQTGFDDAAITLAVERSLEAEESISSHLIDVNVRQGSVRLEGSVSNILEKEKAAKVASTIKGVQSVVNLIKVKPLIRSDEKLKIDLRKALRDHPVTEAYETVTSVKDGNISLSGNVQSFTEKTIAEDVVKAVKGVKNVKNEIQVDYKEIRSDAEIKKDIELRLANDVWLEERPVGAEVIQGSVVLTGAVGSLNEKWRAEKAAWVVGVKYVDIRNLRIKKLEKDPLKKELPRRTKSDEEIKKAILRAFRHDPRVISMKPQVHVLNGEALLTGTVNHYYAKRAAEQDARNTAGVFAVQNLLKVRPPSLLADEDVMMRVEEVLSRDPYLSRHNIVVSAYNNKIYLDGRVDSVYEIERAEDLAAAVQGVADIRNSLEVMRRTTQVSDKQIHETIVELKAWDPILEFLDIQFHVQDGIATLTGHVNTWRQWHAARESAYRGRATHVINQIEII